MRALIATRVSGVVAALALLLAGCASTGRSAPAAGSRSGLVTRTVTAGPVQVTVTPIALDASGAGFAIELNNHKVELDGDYAATSRLTVDGKNWTAPQWSGDGPGGHHRSGTLRFSAGGPATGAVELRIGGLPQPITVNWIVQKLGADDAR